MSRFALYTIHASQTLKFRKFLSQSGGFMYVWTMAFHKLTPVILICLFVSGCAYPPGNERIAKDTMNENEQVSTVQSQFGISEEDLRYIDLMVPEYAEIVLYHEDAPETIAFAKQLIAWFRANHASIELHQVKKITDREPPDTRNFSIDFIGDHRYMVRLFNKTGE